MGYRASSISILALVAGCATAPDTNDVASFGTATTSAVSVIGETSKLENDLAVSFATETNACRYLQSRTYIVGPKRAHNPDGHLVEQSNFLKALSSYAGALSKVTSSDTIEKLKAAATQLTTSATKLLTAVSVAPSGQEAISQMTTRRPNCSTWS